MKLCPYCGKHIVKDALACKHCGEWLADISGYLEKKGSVYAHTDSVTLPKKELSEEIEQSKKSKNLFCVFCESPATPGENEIENKEFICSECGKKNLITNGQTDEVLRNIPIGWGWIVLTAYFTFSIQKYIDTLDDVLQMVITFSLSLGILLSVYFFLRRYILKERYEKKKFFGNIFGTSIIAGSASTIGIVLFVFILHFIYPLTGLQSDRKETNIKVMYYKSKVNEISLKQKEITDIISKPISSSKEAQDNIYHLENYINLNNEEKKYVDSIYNTLGESDYYTGIKDNKKKIKEANLLLNKIIAYKNLSAQNLKNYYVNGDKNALKSIREINSEIANLNNEYSKNYKDLLFLE